MTPQVPNSKPKEDKDPNGHKLSKELQDCLKFLVDKYEKEDSWVRKQQLKLWKKNEEFWHGIQFVFWSESRQDWLSPTMYKWFNQDEGREGVEGPFYDFVINIYKAHGEAIIAALSSQVPTIRFPPDDAEDDDDLLTSKTYAKIADLIQRHNQVKILQLMSFFTLWNQGLLAWYHAPKADKAFGTVNIENFKKQLSCEQCDKSFPVEDEEDLTSGLHSCPDCGSPLETKTVLDSFQESPKSRVLIDFFGGLHVKVPYWARKQGDMSYLIKALDQPKPFLKSIFPHIADEIESDDEDAQQYERMARTPSTFTSFSRADDNHDLATHRQCWMRTWAFEGLPKDKEEEKKELYKKFPNGAYVSFVGKKYAESRDEDMDKYWTLCKVGLSTYIHADAIGQPLIPLQESRNVLFNLTLETVEQGIGSQFADPRVLNFNVYSKHEARPGMIYPAKAREGQTLANSFYEVGRATLSREVGPFGEQIDKDSQFVVGSFPSLYGGPGEGNSRTLGEYQQSRTMALQRLSISWSFFTIAWAKLMERCVHLYVENMIDDEKYVVPDQTQKDKYVNVWIRKADLTGHVGEVEPEGADSFPVSTPQKQTLFFKLAELNNEFINAALFATPNRRIIADLLSFPDLAIPGEEQITKQAVEIADIIKEKPVQIDPLVDDNSIHIEMTRYFLAGARGIDLKKTNPQAFMMVEQHLQQHLMAQEQNEQADQEKKSKAFVDAKANAEIQKQAIKVTAKPALDHLDQMGQPQGPQPGTNGANRS
jgi:hypothetical protein